MNRKIIIRSVLLILIVVAGSGYAYERLNDKPTVITLPEDQLPTMTVNTTIAPDVASPLTAPENVDVGITAYTFSPASVQISKGGTVKWINYDNVPHDIQVDGFNSGLIYHGYTYSFMFNNTGTYNYNCSIHSPMEGTINVV
jgi:plastocyanin